MNSGLSEVDSPLFRPATVFLLSIFSVGCLLFFALRWPTTPNARDDTRVVLTLDLNRATEIELALVPGIGPVMAKRITQNRSEHGMFPSVNALQRVHGIGPKTIKRVSAICVVLDQEASVGVDSVDHR